MGFRGPPIPDVIEMPASGRGSVAMNSAVDKLNQSEGSPDRKPWPYPIFQCVGFVAGKAITETDIR